MKGLSFTELKCDIYHS